MTRVQVCFQLRRRLDEEALIRVAGMRSTYGILRIEPGEGMQELAVEYDATRLQPPDVAAILERAGISVRKTEGGKN